MNKYGHNHKCSNASTTCNFTKVNNNLSSSVNCNFAFEKKESPSLSRSLCKGKEINSCSPIRNGLKKSNYFSSMKDIYNGINFENWEKIANKRPVGS